ncbi:MAG: hypothetical protein COA67_08820 [Lutibacter sp.]|nr:MAG: hypothetical protein COA67_08820 [Lutibacter sp.]
MKNSFFLFVISFFLFISISFSQETMEKNYATFGEFLSEQNKNISLIENGLTLEKTKEIMGPSLLVKVPKIGKMKVLSKLFKQPEHNDKYVQNPEKKVIILWYFTTPKDQNGIITKSECTPILFEKGLVKGKGWKFYISYKRANRLLR